MKTSPLAATLTMFWIAAAPAASLAAAAETPQSLAKWSIHVVSKKPLLTEKAIAQINPGLTEGAVTALIGSPDRTTRFALSDTVAWDYDYHDPWGYDSTFSVIFDSAGLVVSRISTRYTG